MSDVLAVAAPPVRAKPLIERSTAERSEEELERCFEVYMQSKTVNGRFCPTPDLNTYEDELVEGG